MTITSSIFNYLGRISAKEAPQFSLNTIEGFPFEEFSSLQTKYTEAERWYSGDVLADDKTTSGTKVDLYPLRVNPIPAIVQKHTFALFGESSDDDKPLVYPKVSASSEAKKKLAEHVEDTLWQVWFENNGRALQLENGLRSQIYGGCIFRLHYDSTDFYRTIPLRIEAVHPRWFVGKPDFNDYWRFKEAWFVKPISIEDARDYGVVPESEDVWLIEKITPTTQEAWVNNQPARMLVGEKWIDFGKENPFGFVPVVYIPHIRTDSFYGENVFDNVKSMIKEYNLRFADYGDAVNQDSHPDFAMKNIRGTPQPVKITRGVTAIDLGSSPSLGTNEKDPNLWSLRTPLASPTMSDLLHEIFDQIRRDAFLPKVADGEDEGSQRSGLTLAMRMLPLLWHAFLERTFWTVGLNILSRMMLKMLEIKGEAGITLIHATMRIKQEWATVLPRDREMLVNEAVLRKQANLGSIQTLLTLLGDVDDTKAEIKDILDFEKQLSESTAAKASGMPFGQKPNQSQKQPSPQSSSE